MPKIRAGSVREHHALMQTAIVDAAELILRTQGPAGLTAGAVSELAGVARNSIYRYVGSVDELPGLVVARYLPAWLSQLDAALASAAGPRERILAWARVNLEQAASAGHGWLIRLGTSLDAGTAVQVDAVHGSLSGTLREQWQAIAPAHAQTGAALTLAMVDAGMRLVEHAGTGIPAESGSQVVVEQALAGIEALIDRFAEHVN